MVQQGQVFKLKTKTVAGKAVGAYGRTSTFVIPLSSPAAGISMWRHSLDDCRIASSRRSRRTACSKFGPERERSGRRQVGAQAADARDCVVGRPETSTAS
jgi:hypothetical protein